MELFRVEGDGSKRKAEEYTCSYCGIISLRRIGVKKPQRFCSTVCRAAFKSNKLSVICDGCGKTFLRVPNRIKKLNYCIRKCKDKSQSYDGSFYAIKYGFSNHAPTIASLLINRDPKCVQCGESREYRLVVHHIDGDRSHNISDNLEILCGSCHMARHLKLVDGVWAYNSSVLTPRDVLMSL